MGLNYGILDEGPLLLPQDWPLVVDEPLPARTIDEIRRSMRRY
jgi:hypothetical protein